MAGWPRQHSRLPSIGSEPHTGRALRRVTSSCPDPGLQTSSPLTLGTRSSPAQGAIALPKGKVQG